MSSAQQAAAGGGPIRPFESEAPVSPAGKIDEIVFARLRALGIRPARLCSDSVFLRRAYLDVIGSLPSIEEARSFAADRSPRKRAALVDSLLARDEFADYWSMRWCDILRVKAEFPINLWPNAVQAYHRWVRQCLRDNVPYDRFARALLCSSGSNFRDAPVNFYRAVQSRKPEALAQAVALTFMGCRADKWPRARLAGMAAFFAQVGYKSTQEWKEEIVFHDASKPLPRPPAGKKAPTIAPDGAEVICRPGQDPRLAFADWLVAPSNPWFARAVVNRIWYWLMGRGIVHEPDDIRPDNPPSNPALLTWLERQLAVARYDLKAIHRLILTSTTYQLSSIPGSASPRADANFARYITRRVDAEVLIDALNQITGTTESYSSAIPEPFTFVPERQHSVALADGSITSPFLEMFGRPARDTGFETERSTRPSAAQRLHLLNSSHIQRKIERSARITSLLRESRTPREAVEVLYLLILSRLPTDDELRAIDGYARPGTPRGRDTANDVAWALINSAEFLYRH